MTGRNEFVPLMESAIAEKGALISAPRRRINVPRARLLAFKPCTKRCEAIVECFLLLHNATARGKNVRRGRVTYFSGGEFHGCDDGCL